MIGALQDRSTVAVAGDIIRRAAPLEFQVEEKTRNGRYCTLRNASH
jgi:hypothetical protein